MSNELIYFLNGELAIRVSNAEEMKEFVKWLEHYHCEDYLVSNLKYRNEYFKISFWKEIVKQDWSKNKWIHPRSVVVYFVGHSVEGVRTYLYKEDIQKWEGDISIVKPQELLEELV